MKQSAKKLRLFIFLSLLLIGTTVLITKPNFSSYGIVSDLPTEKTKVNKSNEEFAQWREKYGSKSKDKSEKPENTGGKDDKKPTPKKTNPETNPEKQKPPQKPPQKPEKPQSSDQPKPDTKESKKVTSSKVKEPPKTADKLPEEVEEDPANPKGFLGGINELDPQEADINGSIYEEDDDEQVLADLKANKIGDIDHEDVGINPKNKQGYGRLGVPSPDNLGKGLAKTVTVESKPYPIIKQSINYVKPLKFRIYSHNVKNGGHDVLVPGEEAWADRYRKITNSIKINSFQNTIVTLQEVYKFQMLDIMDELNKFSSEDSPEWAYYAKGRIDGEDLGEFVPILYKPSEWELVYDDTLWLNDKNERMSLEGWDAKYLRILSYVTLKHKDTGNHINVFNTHLDHVGELSRIGSAELIVNKMKEINDWPSFLCGDLNNEPKGEAYQILSENLIDSAKQVTPFNRFGHVKSTVTGFEGEVLMAGGQNIDYIFAPSYTKKITYKNSCDTPIEGPGDKILLRLEQFGLLHSKYNGVYMSDHRPLVADFSMQKRC